MGAQLVPKLTARPNSAFSELSMTRFPFLAQLVPSFLPLTMSAEH